LRHPLQLYTHTFWEDAQGDRLSVAHDEDQREGRPDGGRATKAHLPKWIVFSSRTEAKANRALKTKEK